MSAKSLQKHFTIHEESERRAYAKWINKLLIEDKDCSKYIPIDPYTDELYDKTKDGVLLCKLISKTLPDSLDERVICTDADLNENFAKQMDNLCLMLNASRCRGANMGNVDINDIHNGDKFVILETIWQLIRIGFFIKINIHHHPEIVQLKKQNESIDDLKDLSSSDIALRYVNFHLVKSGLRYFINDFDDDFKDCLLYSHLTYRVAPPHLRSKMVNPTTITLEKCVENRARDVVTNLEVLNAECFLTVDDILHGYSRRNSSCKLHMSTIMYLLHYYNGDLLLTKPQHRTKLYGTGGECLEEFTYRNFINSLDVYPFSSHLITDCRNGWIFSELFEIIQPGITSGMRFILDFDHDRLYPQRVHNNMKVLQLCKELSIPCDNIDAEKIADSNKSSIVTLMFRLMQYYFCRDSFDSKQVLDWMNCNVKKVNKRLMVYSFSDRVIADHNILSIMLDTKSPGLVKKELLGANKLKNCRYLISLAHKAGIPIYTLAEHFIEGKTNLVGIAFATLLMY